MPKRKRYQKKRFYSSKRKGKKRKKRHARVWQNLLEKNKSLSFQCRCLFALSPTASPRQSALSSVLPFCAAEKDALSSTPAQDDRFGVLNRGFVRLVDSMGSDAAIVQAARVSYGKGTKKTREDRALIRYLMRHRHSSPFEMCELKLHVKLPLFVARQWVRHRTASLNEYSARYSEMHEEFYVPNEPHTEKPLFAEARLGKQSEHNRQGRSEDATLAKKDRRSSLTARLEERARKAFAFYRDLLEKGVSRELARITLPLSTYTEFYWKANLHNLFHFLELRLDGHAQEEIRLYAETIFEKIVRPLFPQASEAFVDYRLESLNLSRDEVVLLRGLLQGQKVLRPPGAFSQREWQDFLTRFSLEAKDEG